uniref:Abhydrolase domain containing 2b n=1 Tax=Sinocyclocheilus anshuiensis TaxID=1608454 RepID=A0A671PJJ5_9TELE
MSAQVEADIRTISPEMPAMFDGMKLAAVATVLYVIVRSLNLKCPTVSPDITCQDTPLSRYLLKSCPILTKEYIPPLLWGKRGHLQTALYGKMGRVKSPKPCGLCKYLPMSDGATATFDLFVSTVLEVNDITMKHYIWTFVDYSQKQGYRCVLNHLGALPNIELTSPSMFTYENRGCRAESFNIILRIVTSLIPIYPIFTDHVKLSLVNLSCRASLFGMSSSKMEPADLSWLYTATSLMQIDDNIMRRDYEKESCVHYIHNISVPLLLMNSSADPLVHQSLLTIPRTLAEKKQNVTFALTLHGGHLGFFEGAVLFPQPLFWMDKDIVSYANTICQWEKHRPQCQQEKQCLVQH